MNEDSLNNGIQDPYQMQKKHDGLDVNEEELLADTLKNMLSLEMDIEKSKQ